MPKPPVKLKEITVKVMDEDVIDRPVEYRMPVEVKRIIEEGVMDPNGTVRNTPQPKDVGALFGVDDMIMYILNYLKDVEMHNHNGYDKKCDPPHPEYDKYKEEIAQACAEELGDWYWTVFTRGRKCTSRVPPTN